MYYDPILPGGIDQDNVARTGIGEGAASGGGATNQVWGAYGERHYRQINVRSHWVIKLVFGGHTYLFSNTDMQLDEGHVYSVIDESPVIDHMVRLVTKDWSVNEVEVVIKNAGYKVNTAGEQISFADECGLASGGTINIYVLAGPEPTSLVDGYPLFAGVIAKAPRVTTENIYLTARDGAGLKNKFLPTSQISDPVIPFRKNPIVYGEFNKTYNSAVDLGLVKCEELQGKYRTNFLVAGHPCVELSAGFWLQPGLPHPSTLISPTTNVNDSGRCTLNASLSGDYYGDIWADAYLYVAGQYQGNTTDGAGYDDPAPPGTPYSKTIDNQKAGDFDLTSYAKVLDNITGSAVHAHAYFGWPDYDSDFEQFSNSIGRVAGELTGGHYVIRLQWLIDMPDISGTAQIQLLNAPGVSAATVTSGTPGEIQINIDAGQPVDWQWEIVWHLRSGRRNDITPTNLNKPIMVVVWTDTTKTPNAPGREVFRVKYVRLIIRYIVAIGMHYSWQGLRVGGFRYGSWSYWKIQQAERGVYTPGQSSVAAYAACKGRAYGAWIDEVGRTNSYNAGDVIEDPAGIIEDILRSELGLASEDIDVASFDLAYNANVKARLHISSDNESDAFSFIRKLSEQSTFAFCMDGISKPRLVDLKTTTPTISRILDAADIDIDSLVVDKVDESEIVNDIKVNHRYMEEYDSMLSYDTYEDATSKADLNATFSVSFDWPNITKGAIDSVAEVANLILDKWSMPPVAINFVSPGIRNCDLGVGRWIQLDPTTIDPRKLCYGQSWSGKKFLIWNIRRDWNSTFIQAVQLL